MTIDEAEKLNDIKVKNTVETDIKIIGDRNIVMGVVAFLSYLRHAVKNKDKIEFKVSIGSHIDNDNFSFSVNEEAIPDLKPQKTLEIN